MKEFRQWINCKIWKYHNWTSKAQEGVDPAEYVLTLEGFKEYAKMYCNNCGHESELNNW